MSNDKRDGARVAVIARLDGEVMVYQPMVIKEVSLRGALVETRFPLALNSLHDLRLDLGPRSVVVKGRVVHSQIADVVDDLLVYWTGVEFVEPSEHAATAIADFLESIASERP